MVARALIVRRGGLMELLYVREVGATRQLGAAHADLSLVGLNRREPIEPRVGRQIVGVRTASDARHRRRVK